MGRHFCKCDSFLDEHITALSLLGLVFIVGGVLIQTDMKGVLMRKKAEN